MTLAISVHGDMLDAVPYHREPGALVVNILIHSDISQTYILSHQLFEFIHQRWSQIGMQIFMEFEKVSLHTVKWLHLQTIENLGAILAHVPLTQ